MKKWLAMLLSIVLTVQLAVPAWAADGGAEQPETVPGGYTETDPAETPTPEPTVELTAEPTSEPTPGPTEVPVRVRFICTPEELTLAVYLAEGDVDSLILPEEDGSYLLTPGTYTYLAAAEGYETAKGSFTVEETAEEQSVEVVLIPTVVMEKAAEPALLAATVIASGTCGTSLTWKLNSTGTLTISGTGYMSNYSPPDNPAPWYTRQDKIQTVILENGVADIGSGAFWNCSNLTSVTIPNSVESIHFEAFFFCSSLKNISLPNSVKYINNSAFYHCTSLTNITIPESVTGIGDSAFDHCTNLKSVTIPEGVTSIGQGAFNFCTSLISITIPKSVTSIGVGAFSCGNLEMIAVAEDNPVYHSAENCLIHTVDKILLAGCKNSEIPADGSVMSIGNFAFYGCPTLKCVTIPDSVTSIGYSAFSYCTSLTSIIIPKSVTSIGGYAFFNCTSLTDVYYTNCSKTGWENITVGSYNNPLRKATVHYLEHQWDEGKVTIPATCTEDGVKTYTCSACKETKTETVEKLGHSFGAVEVIKAPTCTETGISGKRCQHEGCDVIDSETVIPATGHQWDNGKVTTEPTCTKDGVKTYTCSVCDETKTETIAATGHKWDDGKVTTPATCTEDGVKTYTCSVCKEIKTETVEKLGHAFGAVEVIKAPTCTETGISGKRCTHDGCEVIDSETVIPATGHQWDEGVVTREPTYTENGEKTFTCTVCRTTRTEPIPMLTPELDSVDLNEIVGDFDGSSISMDVDGKRVYPDSEGNYPRLTVPEGTTTLISVSTYNLSEGVDPHTRYPVGMAVYKATNTDGTTSVERISEMDDLLRYAGSSIRITGNKGIRLITGINASLKSALTSEGVAGYTLEEYGTLLCWASEVQNGSLSLSDAYARHNYAYSLANGTDPVFRYAGDVVQYTNVLVGFSNEQCVDDIAMRPYITLRDADGNTYTLYGGIVNRSIGYIAYQNRGAFTPGTNAYNYIWDIIHFVYGDAYDEDYKG